MEVQFVGELQGPITTAAQIAQRLPFACLCLFLEFGKGSPRISGTSPDPLYQSHLVQSTFFSVMPWLQGRMVSVGLASDGMEEAVAREKCVGSLGHMRAMQPQNITRLVRLP